MRGLLLVSLVAVIGGCGKAKKVDHSVPALTETLKDEDPDRRYWAARSLGKFGAEARPAVPALVEALKDESGQVRMGAAYALGEIGPDAREAVPALQGALKDPDKEVRTAAAHALKQMQRKR